MRKLFGKFGFDLSGPGLQMIFGEVIIMIDVKQNAEL